MNLYTADDLMLFQHVCESTRIPASQASIVDLVLSSRLSDVEYVDCLPFVGASDHSILLVFWRRRVLLPPKPHPGLRGDALCGCIIAVGAPMSDWRGGCVADHSRLTAHPDLEFLPTWTP